MVVRAGWHRADNHPPSLTLVEVVVGGFSGADTVEGAGDGN